MNHPLRLLSRRPLSGGAALVAGLLSGVALVSAGYAQTTVQDREWAIPAPLASQSLLLDAVPVPEGLLAVGDRGHILLSQDGGRSWTQTRVPTRNMLCAVDAQGNQCWAVGHDSLILHSDDGGRSWTAQYHAPEDELPLFDVWFRDADYGLAVGAYGLVLETTNGGDEWVRQSFGDFDPHFYDITPGPDDRLYVAGEFGTILRSDDGGGSWEECESPYEGSFFGILPLEDSSVLVFGLRGHLFRSEDLGETWDRLEIDTTASLIDGVQQKDGSVTIVGLNGCILHSEDAGRSFEARSLEDRTALTAVIELDGELLILGEEGVERMGTSRSTP